MPLFPADRTPTPRQSELRNALVAGGLMIALLITTIHLWSEHENGHIPIKEVFYFVAKKDEGWIEKFVGDPVALFTMVLTGATVGLWLATRSLWVATEQLVKGAEDTTRRQLRAYVSVHAGIVQYQKVGDGHCIVINVTLKNQGVTPAYRFKTGLQGDIYKISDIPFANELRSDSDQSSILGPGSEFQIRTNPLWLDHSQMNGLTHKELSYFIWGSARYVDAFDVERYFIFRNSISGPPTPEGFWLLSPHPAGYDAN